MTASAGPAHTVTWHPERYVVDRQAALGKRRQEPDFADLYLYTGSEEYVWLTDATDDGAPDQDSSTCAMTIGGATDAEELWNNVITDHMEIPGSDVYYVWRTDQMKQSGEFTASQQKLIDSGVVAATLGFLNARIELLRRAHPDRIVEVDCHWFLPHADSRLAYIPDV